MVTLNFIHHLCAMRLISFSVCNVVPSDGPSQKGPSTDGPYFKRDGPHANPARRGFGLCVDLCPGPCWSLALCIFRFSPDGCKQAARSLKNSRLCSGAWKQDVSGAWRRSSFCLLTNTLRKHLLSLDFALLYGGPDG